MSSLTRQAVPCRGYEGQVSAEKVLTQGSANSACDLSKYFSYSLDHQRPLAKKLQSLRVPHPSATAQIHKETFAFP